MVYTYPYGIACATEPVEAVAEGNSGDGGSSGEQGGRTTGSAARSPPGAAARTAKTHPEVGSAYCTRPRKADTESGAHYLQQTHSSAFSRLPNTTTPTIQHVPM